MKKVVAVILSALLTICLVACGNNPKYAIEDYTWTMMSEQSFEENGAFVAFVPSDDTFDIETYPEAVVIDMTCSTKSGTFSIVDKTNDKTYNGTYKISESNVETTIYEISIDESNGTAVVSSTNYHDGTKISTMILTIDNYTLNFQSK